MSRHQIRYEEPDRDDDDSDSRDGLTTGELQDALSLIFETLADARDESEADDDDITMADFARDMVANLEGLARVSTFDDAGLLTSNDGLVLKFDDGSEFQITIVQSRRAR